MGIVEVGVVDLRAIVDIVGRARPDVDVPVEPRAPGEPAGGEQTVERLQCCGGLVELELELE